MKITEVKIKLHEESEDRLRAYCSITFDDEFAVKDLKIIEGPGGLFLAMPSRKLTDNCPKCRAKNHLRANYCNQCGTKLPESRMPDGADVSRLHVDVAHPVNAAARSYIHNIVIEEYKKELARRKPQGTDNQTEDAPLND